MRRGSLQLVRKSKRGSTREPKTARNGPQEASPEGPKRLEVLICDGVFQRLLAHETDQHQNKRRDAQFVALTMRVSQEGMIQGVGGCGVSLENRPFETCDVLFPTFLRGLPSSVREGIFGNGLHPRIGAAFFTASSSGCEWYCLPLASQHHVGGRLAGLRVKE